MERHLILIVEDDIQILKMVRLTLDSEGYDTLSAQCAQDALDVLADWRPSLILMDIGLPGMRGVELTRRLRANALTRDIPIVTMTADPATSVAQDALEAGSNSHLVKPFRQRVLLEAVKRHMELL